MSKEWGDKRKSGPNKDVLSTACSWGAPESPGHEFMIVDTPCPQSFPSLLHSPRASKPAKGQPDAKSPGLSWPRALKGDLKHLCIFKKEQQVKDGSRVANPLTGKGQCIPYPRPMTSRALSFEGQNPEVAPPFPPEAPPQRAGSRSHTILNSSPPPADLAYSPQAKTALGQKASGPSC